MLASEAGGSFGRVNTTKYGNTMKAIAFKGPTWFQGFGSGVSTTAPSVVKAIEGRNANLQQIK